MATKTVKRLPRPPILGMVQTQMKIPEVLYQAMKTIQQIRYQREGSQVRLSRLYREAVEQYVNAKPQQDLLKESSNATAKNSRSRDTRLAAGM